MIHFCQLCHFRLYGETANAQPLAFPEADGFGRFTKGGRGGQVYIVTSLEGSAKNHIIFDYCRFRWSINKVASFYNNQHFPLQYSIVAQSLNNAAHIEGEHGTVGFGEAVAPVFTQHYCA